MMRTTPQPYELLIRWGDDGALKGAHVRWLYVTREDTGAVVAVAEGQAEPVAIAGGKGFPLAEILDVVQRDALAERDIALAEVAVRRQERDAAVTAMQAAEAREVASKAAVKQAVARATALEEQLAEALDANRRGARVSAEVAERGT